MSEAGFQAIGDFNNFQVDSTWSNYALVSVETQSASNQNWNGPAFIGTIHTGSQEGDIVFVHCTSEFSILGYQYRNSVRMYGVATRQAGISTTFYIFRKQSPTSSFSGFQVFDGVGSNNLIFDSDSKVARPMLTIPATSLSATQAYPIKGARKYAVLMPSFTGQIIEQWFKVGGGQFDWQYQIAINGPKFSCFDGGINLTGYVVFAQSTIPAISGGSMRITNVTGTPVVVCDVMDY